MTTSNMQAAGQRGRSSRKALAWGSAMLLACLACGAADAATTSTTFSVNATVLASCAISATNLNFGNYDPGSATPDDATSTVSVQCSTGTSYAVSLDAGTTSGSTLTSRNMSDGIASTLNYQLYTDAAHTTVWGDGSGSTLTNSGVGTGSSSQDYTVYGRVPISQFVTSGAYSDTITATVSY